MELMGPIRIFIFHAMVAYLRNMRGRVLLFNVRQGTGLGSKGIYEPVLRSCKLQLGTKASILCTYKL